MDRNIIVMQQTPQVVPVQRFFQAPNKFQPLANFQKSPNAPHAMFGANRQHMQSGQNLEFDGKRLRKAVTRKTVDYNTSALQYLESRVWQRDYRDRRSTQPDPAYYTEIMPPLSMPDNPINAVTTKFVRTSTNKMRCPIFCVAWTPEGRRLVTGASSGEFTLWNGLTFNFETILQAHDSSVRCMVWSHNDIWMVTGDHSGYVKYWQSNMNNVKMFQAHKEPLRGISFCPMDTKFATCSDDGTVRIWDFLRCFEEKILRGHGADVKCVDWHPQKSLIVSGSKDSQQPIKLWDPKSGQSLATVHAHKNTVMDAKWNKNGNWLLTASRDHLIKLFDIRNLSQEMQTFRGHKKEATTLAWHPTHEGLFSSGGSDGSVMFWVVGADKEVGSMEQAHDSCVWSLAWHPLGHILCSGSNDHSSKFWTRNRPGDRMRDKYNLNTLPKGQDEAADYDDAGLIASIPGMGLEYGLPEHLKQPQEISLEDEIPVIPGLDFGSDPSGAEKAQQQKKIPFSKPIPKQFQQQWQESKQPLLLAPPQDNGENQNSEPNPSMMMPHDQANQYCYPNKRGDQNQMTGLPDQERYDGNPAQNNMPYPDHRPESFPHNPPRNENPHETWRTYSDSNTGDKGVNGAPHGFDPSNRGPFQNSEGFPSNTGPPRGPPPSHMHFGGDNNMRFPGSDMNNHPTPHKRSWNESEKNFTTEHPSDFAPMDFGPPRLRMRPPGPMFFGGPRGRGGPPFRGGRSPYRIINRGRGVRSGYPE